MRVLLWQCDTVGGGDAHRKHRHTRKECHADLLRDNEEEGENRFTLFYKFFICIYGAV